MDCSVQYTTNTSPHFGNLKYDGDYVGRRFGNLVVVGYPVGKNGYRLAGAVCKCDCGEYKIVKSMEHLLKGHVVHCDSCSRKLRSETSKARWEENHKDDDHSDNPFWDYRHERLYPVWHSMLLRCGNSQWYKDVSVCPEWHDYLVFREWAYSNGYDDKAPRGKCTIDRINPFGNYEPSNCRWVDSVVQANNKRKNYAEPVE